MSNWNNYGEIKEELNKLLNDYKRAILPEKELYGYYDPDDITRYCGPIIKRLGEICNRYWKND